MKDMGDSRWIPGCYVLSGRTPWPRCRKDTGFNDKDLKAAIQGAALAGASHQSAGRPHQSLNCHQPQQAGAAR
jgi:hypothetical protein